MPQPSADRVLYFLGVVCDHEDNTVPCDTLIQGDFIVAKSDDKATRYGYVLDYATQHGWTIKGRSFPLQAQTYCPKHASAHA